MQAQPSLRESAPYSLEHCHRQNQVP
ncbi:hypothetical protein CGRA01v4_00976 [Colletotrichum graminicola]|nr:hypothetical protein CGRA01v4_00976 [Colletotrichum graminicola]